jgi:hypothetical protein
LIQYPIALVCPLGLNISKYRKAVPDIQVQFVNPKWLASYPMFNRLKVNPLLYRSNRAYEYILFYELDAWVFKNELDYWCSKGYDYIGAPWFEGWDKAKNDAKFLGIGNGGFSLRKVKSHLKVLNTFSYIVSPRKLFANYRSKVSLRGLGNLILNLTVRNNTHYLLNDWTLNEDYFWGFVAHKNFKWFLIPDITTALKFSIEVNPQSYIFSEADVPFGCHGWWKYNLEFWNQYISKSLTEDLEG